MIVLGIETSCDETGVSIVQDGKRILSNVLASSSDVHKKYGGVFPELACRRHMEVIIPLIDQAMKEASLLPHQIDLIAVTKGPGLIGALLIGLNAAKGLSIAWNKPLLGIHHIEAHLYASMMPLDNPPFPSLGIVLSGGHTLLVRILEIGKYEPIGETVDDAIGEAFDKTASLLGLPYPGGPEIEKLALQGNPKAYPFKAGNVKKSPFDFSFSGLKTAVLYAMKKPFDKADLAASFQETAFQDVCQKALQAKQLFPYQAIFFGGGVSSNQRLKKMAEETFPSTPLFFPEPFLALDNAAMIAALAGKKALFLKEDGLSLEAKARIPVV